MKIELKNKSDLEKFYKRIKYYRTFWYRFVKFELINNKNSDGNVEKIIMALNIKSRKKRLCYVYDQACLEINNYFNNRNLCDFVNNQCLMQRKIGSKKINGCCRMCRYQSDKGCQTSNLACKFFYCSEVKKRIKVLVPKDIQILKLLTKRQLLILGDDFFAKREDVINDLYWGWISIASLRISYRLIKNYIVVLWRNYEKDCE